MEAENKEFVIYTRGFSELTDAEVETLREFSARNRPNGLMLDWLRLRMSNDLRRAYVSMVWLGGRILGWAAVVPHGHRLGLAGALVDWNCQKRGCGRLAVRAVLRHIAELSSRTDAPEDYTHIFYTNSSLERLFHPEILAAGFGDFVTDREEYCARYHNRPR